MSSTRWRLPVKDEFLRNATANVEHLFTSDIAEDAARSTLLTFCDWLNEEKTVEELAAELLRGTPSTDLTAAKDRVREVTRQVEQALRRRIGWEL